MLRVLRVTPDLKERPVYKEKQGNRDLLALPVRREYKVKLALKGRKAKRALKAPQGHPVHKVLRAPKVIRVSKDTRGHKETQGHQE